MEQVIAPAVRAYLYTWGGRKTAEGEKIPVRIEELDIGYIDGMLLLPLVVEHSIDERSPLYGHTYESLRVCSMSHNSQFVHWTGQLPSVCAGLCVTFS